MPGRTVTRAPKYPLHKPSSQAVATLVGRDHDLGPYSSDESEEGYRIALAGRKPTMLIRTVGA